MANEAQMDKMFEWYENLYPAVNNSKVYSEYCYRVYGKDLSQQNFCTMSQIDFMLSLLSLNSHKKVVDMGCGTGKLAEYISDVTGATVYGFDYSPAAISLASERTQAKQNRVAFEIGNINDISYSPEAFDTVISVDTLYFADNLENVVKKAYSWLRSGGILAFYYGVMRFNRNEPKEIMLADKSPLANAFTSAGLSYSVFDFTKECFEHNKLKRRTALALKSDFENEGTAFLYDYIFRESIDEARSFSDFEEFNTRYLYVCKKF